MSIKSNNTTMPCNTATPNNTTILNKTIMPYKTIGIIGGGQLGRMMCLAAKAMGYKVAVLDPTPNCPCGQVSDIEITAKYNDMDGIKKLAQISDVITYEFENIDYDALTYLEKNAYLPQGSNVLKITQHRFKEKSAIRNMGIPVPGFCLVNGPEDIIYHPGVLKTTMGGYDGKGQIVIKHDKEKSIEKSIENSFEKSIEKALELARTQECILEEFMPFDKEISVIVARSTAGETSVFPVAENIHVNNILHQSIVPARISKELEGKAIAYAKKIAEELDCIGILAIEMFVVGDEIFINELAPRPHNSGHYTIDACITSQFEQHVRAVCGLPLGPTDLHTPVVMVNILGDHMDMEQLSRLDNYMPLMSRGKLHLYGKAEAKIGRKMGHINLLGDVDESFKIVENSGIWR